MNEADRLLEFLATRDGLHRVDEISEMLNIPFSLCEQIIQFAAKYGFVYVEGIEVEITPEAKKFVIATLPRINELKM